MLLQEIIGIIVTNTVTGGLLLFVFSIYKKKIEDSSSEIKKVEAKVDEVVSNYLTRFEDVKTLIMDNDKEILGKISELHTQVATISATCSVVNHMPRRD